MTLERGQDPRRLPLVAFGGAGGLHAGALAASLGMPCAIVPRHPGALSAWGMTRASALVERVRTVLAPLSGVSAPERAERFAELERDARAELREEGARETDILCERELDLRYRGQSSELLLPEGPDPGRAFAAAHEKLYGYALEDAPLELVCLRLRARVAERSAAVASARAGKPLPARSSGVRRGWFAGRELELAAFRRAELGPGCEVLGPAAIEEYSGTVLVPPGARARVVSGGHLRLEAGS
jgi:N-methylhydantoinase A